MVIDKTNAAERAIDEVLLGLVRIDPILVSLRGFHSLTSFSIANHSKMSIGLPSIAYANSADAPYIPSSKERGFTVPVDKATLYGKKFIAVDPKNTTQTCCICGHVMEGENKIRLGTEEWTCPVCNSHHSRDWNAAKNILKKGLDSLDCGGKAPQQTDG